MMMESNHSIQENGGLCSEKALLTELAERKTRSLKKDTIAVQIIQPIDEK